MKTKVKGKKISIIVASLVFVAHLFLFLKLVILENTKQGYLYLKISNPKLFVIAFLFAIVIPCILFIGNLLILKIQRKTLSRALFIIILVVNCLWMGVSFIFAGVTRGGITSHTENFENYQKWDDNVEDILQHYEIKHILPDKHLLNKQSDYEYDYDYGAYIENFYIRVDAIFDKQEGAVDEWNNLMKEEWIKEKERQYYIKSEDSKLYAYIMLGEDENVITYVISYGRDKNIN